MRDPRLPEDVTIIDRETAEEECRFVCCVAVTDLAFKPKFDHLIDHCCKCGCDVVVSPLSPKTPPRICNRCLTDLFAEEPDVNHELAATQESIDEAVAFMKTRSH